MQLYFCNIYDMLGYKRKSIYQIIVPTILEGVLTCNWADLANDLTVHVCMLWFVSAIFKHKMKFQIHMYVFLVFYIDSRFGNAYNWHNETTANSPKLYRSYIFLEGDTFIY